VTKPWQTSGVGGMRRFLNRSWRLICTEEGEFDKARITDEAPEQDTLGLLHQTIDIVTNDLDGLRFNTAIARLMELVNELTPRPQISRAVIEPFVLLLSPFAPHMCEELWSILGHRKSLAYEPWPKASAEIIAATRKLKEYPVQVNGTLRARVMASPDLDKEGLLAAVKQSPEVQAQLAGKTVLKEVVVPGRLVNFVIGK
jgi:leucyl-tRNA synthetase